MKRKKSKVKSVRSSEWARQMHQMIIEACERGEKEDESKRLQGQGCSKEDANIIANL